MSSPAPSAGFRSEVCDYRTYERQIERLNQRGHSLEEHGVPLARLNFHRSSVAKVLARVVTRGEYVPQPARRKTIRVDGKTRNVFRYRLTDLIVHGAVADVIARTASPRLSPQLYSYRQGTGSWTAVADFARYLRHHRKQITEPTQRHMYILRRDIDSYTDSIPLAREAPVWEMLRQFLAHPPVSEPDWQLIQQVVRPEVEVGEGGPVRLDQGVPTGQPISCVLFNLYLAGFDEQLDTVPGAFYARYSDDLLFAHPSAEVVRATSALLSPFLEKLGLRLKETKSQDLYLTGAGRSSADWSEAVGTSVVPFMGALVHADGTVSLGRNKTRRLLRDLRDRFGRVARSLHNAGSEELGRALCASVNQMLTPERTPFVEANSAALLRRAVTNRACLSQLDHWIARMVLRAVTGEGGVRAFRQIPYHRLRQWGLLSLEQERNCWGRKEKSCKP